MDKYILHDPMPAWFEIGLEGPALFIAVHQSQLEGLFEDVRRCAPFIGDEKDMAVFVPPPNERWGFGGVLGISQDPKPGWIRYQCTFPPIRVVHGTQERISWERARCVSRTLSLLFQALEFPTTLPDHETLQLCCPKVFHSDQILGCAIAADLSPSFIRWIKRQLQQVTDEKRPHTDWKLTTPSRVLFEAYQAMWAPEAEYPTRPDDFEVTICRPSRIHFNIPGSACGLDPGSNGLGRSHKETDDGYTLEPHNVDSSLQQLTLLAGLAAVCDLIRTSDT